MARAPLPWRPIFLRALLFGSVLALFLSGCERGEVAITSSRVTTSPKQVKPDATSADRFPGFDGHMGGSPASQGGGQPLVWQTPPTWKERPVESGPRMASFSVRGEPDGDCSISIAGGDVPTNVNRWRKQMGSGPLSQDEIDKLPATELLGRRASLVELEGTYAGMGDSPPRASWKLLGVMLPLGDKGMLFVKATGPKALLDAEKTNFLALVASIKISSAIHGGDPHGDPHADPHGNPHGGDPHANPHGDAPGDEPPASIGFDAPEGWKRGPPAPMRLMTFTMGTASECALSEFPGEAGGLAANVNRWRDQMGQGPLSGEQLAALPRVKAFGQDVALVEVYGTYVGGRSPREGWGMLGAACPHGDSTVFVKLNGPEAEVRAERDRFKAFVGSLR